MSTQIKNMSKTIESQIFVIKIIYPIIRNIDKISIGYLVDNSFDKIMCCLGHNKKIRSISPTKDKMNTG
jgi:hypothetical protein